MTTDEIFALATRSHQAGDESQARQFYEVVIRQNPRHFAALFGLGLLTIKAGRAELACVYLRQAVASNPLSADAHFHLAGALTDLGRVVEAIVVYQQAIHLDPNNAAAHNNLGALFASQRRLTEAETCFRQAVALRPDYFKALCNLANFLAEPGHYDQAANYAKQALNLRPEDAVLRYFHAALTGLERPATAPREYVEAMFNSCASSFDSDLAGLNYRGPRMMRDVISDIPGAKSLDILDLGCGTGLSGAAFTDLARTLVGVDISPNMLSVARDRGIYDQLIEADILEPLADPAAFDLILSADVFIYVGDLAAVFRAVRRALRPGGRFAFVVETHEGSDFVLRRTRRYAHSLEYIRKLTTEAGMTEFAMTSDVVRTEYGSNIDGYAFAVQ